MHYPHQLKWHKIILWLISNILLLLSTHALSNPLFNIKTPGIKITAVRLSTTDEKTRIVFDLSNRLPYPVEILHPNPFTVTLQLISVQFQAQVKAGLWRGSRVKNLQIEVGHGKLTLLLALQGLNNSHVFALPANKSYANRLVVDVFKDKTAIKLPEPRLVDKTKNSMVLSPSHLVDKTKNSIVLPESHLVDKTRNTIVLPQPHLMAQPKSVMILPRKGAVQTINRGNITANIIRKPQSVTPTPNLTNSHPLLTQPVLANSIPNIPTKRSVIVVIDPGHGGKDPGAAGKAGVREKRVVLTIAKSVQMQLNTIPGIKARLTRDDDYFLTLRKRLAVARAPKADAFISIHADAFPDPRARGASVYILSPKGASSEAARWLAQRENYSELGTIELNGKNALLCSVLLDLSQTETQQNSQKLATDILKQLIHLARLHRRRVEQAPFAVLKSPDIPSVLIETGFISNTHDERELTNKHYQQQLAKAITSGIQRYFTLHPPENTVFEK